MTYDADLNLLVCEHVTSSLMRERPDGTRELLAYHYEGKDLNSPNDVCVRSDGSIYFSDPWYGRFPGFGIERGRELGWQGVFRIPPGGGQDELELCLPEDEFDMPNGLCFSPDESLLYINDTPRAHIKVCDVNADGSLSNGRMFFEGVGTGVIEEGVPRRDEVRRAREHLGHRPEGRLGDQRRRASTSASSRCPRASATSPGAARTGTRCSSRASTSLYSIRTKVGPRREPYMR